MDSLLIDHTLQEIATDYKAGLLAWLKRQPDRWDRLLQMEGEINRTALPWDEHGLAAALEAYKAFFREMVDLYEKAEEMPLFKGGK